MDSSVLVLEDDDFIRMTLVETLSFHGLDVVADCKTAADAITAAQKFSPQAAILDLDLGRGPTGLDVARTLRRLHPPIGIVFLTSFSDPRLVASPGQEAPAGSQYLVKRSVSAVAVMLSALEKSLVSHTVPRWGANFSTDFGRLTNSQVETLRLIAKGLSNQEIAKQRSITEKSVEQQISRIARRLGIERDLERNVRVGITAAYFRQAGA